MPAVHGAAAAREAALDGFVALPPLGAMRPNWFVALPVDGGAWFKQATRQAPDFVRVLHPGDLHITVAFLGGVSESAALAAWALADGVSTSPFRFRLGNVVPLGPKHRPSALSATLERGADAAVELIEELRDGMLQAAGARPETRAPLAHVTLARPRRTATDNERNAAIAWARSLGRVNADLSVDTIALYTWSDERQARAFRVVQRRALA